MIRVDPLFIVLFTARLHIDGWIPWSVSSTHPFSNFVMSQTNGCLLRHVKACLDQFHVARIDYGIHY